ncbi:MAG: sel1 repeat family protein [Gammaproteobacteria bacterium]|nr:sel1 repeat family protein [Gammaproteobacteria bacterium]
MEINQYLDSVDLALVKEYESKLSTSKIPQDNAKMYNRLISSNEPTFTYLYFAYLVKTRYDDENIDFEDKDLLELGRNNLFIDSLLLRNIVENDKEYLDKISIYKSLAPMLSAFKILMEENDLKELRYLYACLLALDLSVTQNLDEAFDIFFNLYSEGHVMASVKLAELIMKRNDLYSEYNDELFRILRFACDHGARYAYYLYSEVYQGKPLEAYRDDKLSQRYYEKYLSLLGKQDKEENNKDVITKIEETIPEVEDIEPTVYDKYPFLKEYISVKTPKDSYVGALRFLDYKVKQQYPLFYYMERARIMFNLGEIPSARLSLRKAETFFTDEIRNKNALELGLMYYRLKEYDDMLPLLTQVARTNKEALVCLIKYFEEIEDINNIKKYYLYYTIYNPNAYYHLYKLTMEQNDYQEAISYLEEGYAISSPLCTKELGELYYHGDYVQKDIRKATDYFLEGYKLRSNVSTYYLGKILFYGEGCVENKKKGKELINKALSLGYVDKEGDIYEILYHNQLRNQIKYLKKIYLEYKDFKTAIILAKLYYDHKNYKKAVKYFKVGRNHNDAESMYYLAMFYKNGDVIDRNFYKAYDLFKESLSLGYKKSQVELGIVAYRLKKYDEAHKNLLLSDNKTDEAYEILYKLHDQKLIENSNTKDAKYFLGLSKDTKRSNK